MAITDVIRRIYEDDEDGKGFLDVTDSAEFKGMVNLTTLLDAQSSEYYGVVDLNFSPDMAEQLGLALIACAKECRDAKG